MKARHLAPALLALLAACASAPHGNARTSDARTYGEPMRLETASTVAVADVLAAPEAWDGKTARVSGTVRSVCAKRGCWLRLGADGSDRDVFVKFTCPVEGRLIPLEAVGHPATVEGTVVVTEISEAEARHDRADAGASEEEIAKIVGPQRSIRIQSPAAAIEGL